VSFRHVQKTTASGFPLFEVAAAYDAWLKWLLIVVLGLTLVPGILLFPTEPAGGWILLGATMFDALLFHSVLPRRFAVFDDRLRIVLGWPFAINIPLDTIRQVRAVSGGRVFVYWGARLATSSRNVVEIDRSRGLSMVVSPQDRDAFIYHVQQALG